MTRKISVKIVLVIRGEKYNSELRSERIMFKRIAVKAVEVARSETKLIEESRNA